MSLPNLEPGFYVIADGKRYGPYKNRFEDQIGKLLHLKGITVEHGMFPKECLLPAPKPRKPTPPKNLSLLEGLDWMPQARRL